MKNLFNFKHPKSSAVATSCGEMVSDMRIVRKGWICSSGNIFLSPVQHSQLAYSYSLRLAASKPLRPPLNSRMLHSWFVHPATARRYLLRVPAFHFPLHHLQGQAHKKAPKSSPQRRDNDFKVCGANAACKRLYQPFHSSVDSWVLCVKCLIGMLEGTRGLRSFSY